MGCVRALFLVEWVLGKGTIFMNPEQSKALGELFRQKRKELGYSVYQVADAAGVRSSTVVRFEQGKFAAPRPDKLARFASLLGIPLADVYARAGYLVPKELPSFESYLKTKYQDLPATAVIELKKLFEELSARHGLDNNQAVPITEEAGDYGTRDSA